MSPTLTASTTACRKTYRSRDGRHYFKFTFVPRGSHLDIYCTQHPGFNGQDTSVSRSHLYDSGLVCFVSGQEPRTQREAETRASQFAEYFLVYRMTGKAAG